MKHAIVILRSDGNVLIAHSPDLGSSGAPSSSPGDLENLLSLGYQAKREILIGTGQVLLVLEKPT